LSDKKKKTLVLLDSNALIHRAYHALPPLTNKEGQLTNAVYGYALTLFSVLEKIKPGYIVATFDLEGPTFRHEQYKEYKATRKKADDELYAQIPMVKEMLQAFNIPIYEKNGFEATLSEQL
jgi:DNA polymerase-1